MVLVGTIFVHILLQHVLHATVFRHNTVACNIVVSRKMIQYP